MVAENQKNDPFSPEELTKVKEAQMGLAKTVLQELKVMANDYYNTAITVSALVDKIIELQNQIKQLTDAKS